MPIIELIFPLVKPNAQLIAEFVLKKPDIFKHFLRVDGLKTTLQGRITEDAGENIEENSGRTAMVLGAKDPLPRISLSLLTCEQNGIASPPSTTFIQLPPNFKLSLPA